MFARRSALYLIVVAIIVDMLPLRTAHAEPSAAPASQAQPPTKQYAYQGSYTDAKGKFELYMNYVTDRSELGHKPIVWVKVVRFKSDIDKKSDYPVEYLRYEAVCSTWSYAVTAKFELDANGRDLNPTAHFSKNPVQHKIPGLKGRVYVKPGVSPPEMVAAGLLDQQCTAPE